MCVCVRVRVCVCVCECRVCVVCVCVRDGMSWHAMAWKDPRDGTGLWWKLVNRNKRNIALDLKLESDREIFLKLVDDADVLVENFRPGTLERLGLP